MNLTKNRRWFFFSLVFSFPLNATYTLQIWARFSWMFIVFLIDISCTNYKSKTNMTDVHVTSIRIASLQLSIIIFMLGIKCHVLIEFTFSWATNGQLWDMIWNKVKMFLCTWNISNSKCMYWPIWRLFISLPAWFSNVRRK